MEIFSVVKNVASAAVASGVGTIVTNIVKVHSPAEMGLVKKICVTAGTFVVTTAITDVSVKHFEGQFVEMTQSFKEARAKVKDAVKKAEADLAEERAAEEAKEEN